MSNPLAFSRTQRSARAVAEALFFDPAAPPPAARLDWVVTEVADLLRHAGTRSRGMFQLCLFLVSWLAPLWLFRLPPLRRLPLGDRVRALTKMEDSRTVSPLVLACKTVLCMVYYEDEGALRVIGAYEPCTPEQRRLPLLPRPAAPPIAGALPADGGA
jgi:hypothetical protein